MRLLLQLCIAVSVAVLGAAHTLRSDGLNVLMAFHADIAHSSLRVHLNGHEPVHRSWVECWNQNPSVFLEWRVTSNAYSSFSLRILAASSFSLSDCFSESKSNITVRISLTRSEKDVICRVRYRESVHKLLEMQRVDCSGRLNVEPGVETIRMTASAEDGDEMSLSIHSIELITEEKDLEMRRLANQFKGDYSWLDASPDYRMPFGLFLHWNTENDPLAGPKKTFPEAVRDFDLGRFVREVERSGATFVVLTMTWGKFYIAGPIEALERRFNGRTTQRDLIGEMATALKNIRVKLVLYYHYGKEDAEWWERARWGHEDFWEIWIDIISSVGERYKDLLAGWWIDDGALGYYHQNPPWDRLTLAAKAGYPQRLVGYNSWALPSPTVFQDFYTGEVGFEPASALLFPDLNPAGFFTHGPQKGLKATYCFLFDSNEWTYKTPAETSMPTPKYTLDFVKYLFSNSAARGLVPLPNLAITQEGFLVKNSIEILAEASAFVKNSQRILASESGGMVLTGGSAVAPASFIYWAEKESFCGDGNAELAAWRILTSVGGPYRAEIHLPAPSDDPTALVLRLTPQCLSSTTKDYPIEIAAGSEVGTQGIEVPSGEVCLAVWVVDVDHVDDICISKIILRLEGEEEL